MNSAQLFISPSISCAETINAQGHYFDEVEELIVPGEIYFICGDCRRVLWPNAPQGK